MKLPLVEAPYFSEIQDSDGKHIASVSTFPDSDLVPQRRAFIVQACNSHDALVAALTRMQPEYQRLEALCRQAGLWDAEEKEIADEVNEQARQALSQATLSSEAASSKALPSNSTKEQDA